MAENLIIPRLGQTMTEATIIEWLKKDGDRVRKGEGLVEIETDKVTNTIESPQDGTLKIMKPKGDVVPVYGVIAVIND